jgi:hypothetical protein
MYGVESNVELPANPKGLTSVSTVLVLGAGFSRAISEHMPVTDELGNLVVERLKPDGLNPPSRSFDGGYFEAWLSRLAEDQPDLTDAQNMENRAWFLRISTTVHSILAGREVDVLNQQAPWWLQKLLGVAHANRMTLVTFNYDTLVEHTVSSYFMYDWVNKARALPTHVIDNLPPLPPGPARLGPEEVNTLRLIKLHGSIDTYWVPDDKTGATINRLNLTGSWGNPEPVDDRTRRRELPGRSAFIVPPASAKSAFYNNPVTREFWRTAAEAIGESRQVALLGYSLPSTDLVATGMLANQLATHPPELHIVNPYPEPIANRLNELRVEASFLVHGGASSIPDFVEYLEAEVCRSATSRLLGEPDTLPLVVAVSEAHAAMPTEIRLDENEPGGWELLVEPFNTLQDAIRSRRTDDPSFVRLANLQPLIGHGNNNLVTVVFPDGQRARIINSTRWHWEISSEKDWLVLIPSAAPRPSI